MTWTSVVSMQWQRRQKLSWGGLNSNGSEDRRRKFWYGTFEGGWAWVQILAHEPTGTPLAF